MEFLKHSQSAQFSISVQYHLPIYSNSKCKLFWIPEPVIITAITACVLL